MNNYNRNDFKGGYSNKPRQQNGGAKKKSRQEILEEEGKKEFQPYSVTDFFNEERIKEELINNIGDNNVQKLAGLLADKVTINQVRKHYDAFLRVYNTKNDIEQKKVQLIMLKANVIYNAKRNNQILMWLFIDNRFNIVLARGDNDFSKYVYAMKLHFEALIGYFPKK